MTTLDWTIVVGFILTLTGWLMYRFRETPCLTLAQYFEVGYSRKFRMRHTFILCLALTCTLAAHADIDYIATQGLGTTDIYDATGKVVAKLDTAGTALAFDSKGNLFIGNNNQQDGKYTIRFMPYKGNGQWGEAEEYCKVNDTPRAMAVAKNGTLYIGVLAKSNVYKCTKRGSVPRLYCGVNNDSRAIQDLAIGSDGKVWLGLVAWGYLRFPHKGGFNPELTIYNNGNVGGLAFGPDRNGDGKPELYGSVDKSFGTIGYYDAATGKKLGTLFNDQDSKNYCMSFGPDRNSDGIADIYVATYDDRTRIYDTMTGKKLGEISKDNTNSYLTNVQGLSQMPQAATPAPPPAKPVMASTHFFLSHPNAIDLVEQDSSILFANKHIGIEIKQSGKSFELARIYGAADDQDFMTGGAHEIFQIAMTLDPKHVRRDDRGEIRAGAFNIIDQMAGDVFSVRPNTAASASWRRENTDGATTLYLTWKNMPAQENKGVVDVEVAITLRQGDPLSRWRINVTNRSDRYGIARVRFPMIEFAPIGDPKQNVQLLPIQRGEILQQPFNQKNAENFYPHNYNMQFQAIYNKDSLTGIYFGTEDPAASFMVHDLFNRQTEITWRAGHFPKNITFSKEDFALSYDCVIGPFHGDWFDACQIYRKWAIKQSWCRKGPLSTRKDIPKWFKESPLYLYTYLTDSAKGTHSVDENLPIAEAHYKEFLEWAGVPLPATFYGWKDYKPGMTSYDVPFNPWRIRYHGRWADMPQENVHDGNYPKIGAIDQFAATCQRLRKLGGMVSPYIALEIYDQGPTENAPYVSQARDHVVRDLYGAIRTWGAGTCWQMCVATDWWRDRLKETAIEMSKREHVGGLYLDVMQGSGLPCYWTPHGHVAAGGDSMTKGMHELVEIVTNALKEQDPEAITTGENASENMIDVTDGVLQVALSPRSQAPLFAAVYQDYITRHGLELSVGSGWMDRWKDTWRANHFFIECASMFVEGAQIGRIQLRPRDNSLDLHKPEHKPMVDYVGQMVGYYRQEQTKKFLSYGQLLRPLTISTEMLDYKGGKFPALMSGVFRGEDGELGVFIVNASNQKQKLDTQMDLTRYGIKAATPMQVSAISPDGKSKQLHTQITGTVRLNHELPGHGIMMYLIKPSQN